MSSSAEPCSACSGELTKLRRRWERERNARLAAESIAERGLRELYERKQQLELVGDIAIAANETGSVDDVLRFALTRICLNTAWPLGHVYIASERDSKLLSTGIWYGSEPELVQNFRRATESTDLVPGVGLPGRVLQSGQPAWIADVREDANFPRAEAARASGLRSGFAFPVLAGSEVAAVLEFFSDRVVEPDEFFLRLMAQIGTQLGRVVERRRTENQLVHDASHDPLTGLPNRALFLDRLTRAVARHNRHPEAGFAVLFIDLDRFKVVNDSLGHHVGDRLIVDAAARLCSSLRREDLISRSTASIPDIETDTLARLGGDEFTILLDDVRDICVPVRIAERIQELLALPFTIAEHQIYVSASIGIAWSTTGYISADEVIRDADLAMYRAKATGKARYEIYNKEMFASAVQRLELENELRKAVRRNEFVCNYQPIVDLTTRQIVGFEALVRWQRPGIGLVYPDKFIGVAEETGLIVLIDRWVLRQACLQMRQWHRQFPRQKPLTISVNVSARQFAQSDMVQAIRAILDETGIAPESVRLEITESVTMNDVERTILVLSELRELGVRISIDDFGTGFSSLSYLHRFPLDVLKIDRSFIARLGEDAESQAIVETILDLARNLGMEVVAEGAETSDHVAKLSSLKCGFGQGYFFSRPVDPAAVSNLLQSAQENTLENSLVDLESISSASNASSK